MKQEMIPNRTVSVSARIVRASLSAEFSARQKSNAALTDNSKLLQYLVTQNSLVCGVHEGAS
jgi:hypothetical protein